MNIFKRVGLFFDDYFPNRSWSGIGKFIHSSAEIAALILLFSHFSSEWEGYEFILFIIAISLLVLTIIISTYASFKRGDIRRNARYAEAIPFLNMAYTELHVALSKKPLGPPSHYEQALEKFCNRISQSFTLITGSHCHVCIKSSGESGDEQAPNYFSVTISRENIGMSSDPGNPIRGSHDNSGQHLYEDNTDFNEILLNIKSNKARYFFSNSLPSLKKYRNSSFVLYGFSDSEGFPPETAIKEKRRKWPLPYKSTIVAAICPSISEQSSEDKIAGFICVDSSKEGNFVEEVDTHLLIGCANGLYNILDRYKMALKRQNNKAQKK